MQVQPQTSYQKKRNISLQEPDHFHNQKCYTSMSQQPKIFDFIGQSFVRKKVLEYFPNSGFELAYPEKPQKVTSGIRVFKPKECQVKSLIHGQVKNDSHVYQPHIITTLSSKDATITRPQIRTFISKNQLSQNEEKRFGYIKTFNNFKPSTNKQYYESTKQQCPENINNFMYKRNIIHWKDEQIESPEYRNKRAISGFQKNAETSNEFQFEILLGRKKKISSIDQKRNNLPIKSLGDKNYKFPEHTHDFFHIEGGLVPGSTMKKQKEPFKIEPQFNETSNMLAVEL